MTAINNWCCKPTNKTFNENKLLVNVNKTKYMFFTNQKGTENINVCLNGTSLKESQNLDF